MANFSDISRKILNIFFLGEWVRQLPITPDHNVPLYPLDSTQNSALNNGTLIFNIFESGSN